MNRFSGVWCAALTPLHPDASIHLDRWAQHLGFLFENGCHGVALFGSTGEAASFSVRERIKAVEGLLTRDVSFDRIVLGGGASALPDAVKLCESALACRAAGVLLHPPYYYRQADDEGLFQFFRGLFEAVPDPDLRIVLYHFPRLIGVGYSEELIARLISAFGTRIAGLKDSSGDLDRMRHLATRFPDLSVLAGTERLLAPLARSAGAGCMTASTNVTARLARAVWDAHAADSATSALQDELTAFRSALETAPFVPGLKHIMARETDQPDWLLVRAPLRGLTKPEAERLERALEPLPRLPNFAD